MWKIGISQQSLFLKAKIVISGNESKTINTALFNGIPAFRNAV